MNSEFRIQLHCVEIHVVLGRVVSTYDLRFASCSCDYLKSVIKVEFCALMLNVNSHDAITY